jgi:hypothetical protein
MAGPIEALALGIQDSFAVRATAKLSPNLRVTTTTGPVGTVLDIVQFPGPNVIGNWVVPNQRTLVNGLPTIGASSTGMAYMPSITGLVPTGPMLVVQGDARVSAM